MIAPLSISLLAAGVLAVALPIGADAAGPPTASELIDRQLAAYNAKNLDAFLACYAADAELFEFPDKPLGKGTAALRERYQPRFADPILQAKVTDRMVIENRVIDQEHIVRTWPEGPGTLDAVVIYELEGQLIKRAWFILGAKTLDAKK